MYLKIPYNQINTDTLRGIIEQYVSRDGSDSGHVSVSFEEKVAQVQRKIMAGKAFILYDEETRDVNVVSANDPSYRDYLQKSEYGEE